MINSINLNNFQSHKDTTLEFHTGINAIVGESDNGKTAILRALFWARYNQPAGDAYISKWARNEKGNQEEDTKVTIEKNDCTLVRGKGKSLNGYDVNGKILEALGKGGLPVEVTSFFNTTEVNMQAQMDSPFLIGSTASEISKFLNDIVDMTEIDEYLSLTESKKRANNKEIKRSTTEIKELEEQIIKYNTLPEVSSLLSKLEKLQNRRVSKIKDVGSVSELLSTYTTIQQKSTLWANINKLEDILNKVKPLIKKRMDLQKQNKLLLKEINNYEVINESLKDVVSLDELEPLLNKVSKIIKDRKQKEKELKKIARLVDLWNTNNKIIENSDKLIKKLEKELPDVCPTCGQAWHRG